MRSLLDPPAAAIEKISGDVDVAFTYRMLDWLVRSWMVKWGRSVSPEVQLALFAEAQPITDVETAAVFAYALTELDQGLSKHDEEFVKENYSGNDIEEKAVKVAKIAASEAVKASAGNLVLDVVSKREPEAFRAAHPESSVNIVASFAFSRALDSAWEACQDIAYQVQGSNATHDADVLASVLRAKIGAVAPVVARNALGEAVEELQGDAIRLHNQLMADLAR